MIPEESLQSENVHRVRMIALREQSKFYKTEQWKTFTAFLLLNVAFFVTSTSLALTHQRLPDQKKSRPLPDIVLDNVESIDYLLNISEIQIMVVVNLTIVLVFFHKFR